MAKYEIYTEDKNLSLIEKKLNSYFQSFTIQKQLGYWKGKVEKSLCIVIFTDDPGLYKMKSITRKIKELNDQETVLVWDGNQEIYV